MRIFAVVLAILVLAGCSSAATRTGVELEQKSSENNFISSKSDVVPLPLNKARGVLVAFSKACYDGYRHRVQMPTRVYDGVPLPGNTIVMDFKAEITNEDGQERYVVWKQDHDVIQLSDKTKGFIVMSSTKLEAVGNETKVTSYYVFPYGSVHKEIMNWMKGDTSDCIGR